MPSLLPPGAALPDAVADYVVTLGLQVLRGFAGMPEAALHRIAVRRHLQTRAYYAWLLRWALGNGWVAASGDLAAGAIAARLSAYLDTLERALRQLASGGTAAAVVHLLAEADQDYEAAIRAPLAAAAAHTRYRYHVFPYIEATGGIIGY